MNGMPVEGNLTADEEEYWLEVGNSLAVQWLPIGGSSVWRQLWLSHLALALVSSRWEARDATKRHSLHRTALAERAGKAKVPVMLRVKKPITHQRIKLYFTLFLFLYVLFFL